MALANGDLRECTPHTRFSCMNDGRCFFSYLNDDLVFCVCPPPYYGKQCEKVARTPREILDRALTIIAIIIMLVIVSGILILSWYLARRRRLDLENFKNRRTRNYRNKATQVNRGVSRQKSNKKMISIAIGNDTPVYNGGFEKNIHIERQTFPLLHNQDNYSQRLEHPLGSPIVVGSKMGPHDSVAIATADLTITESPHQPMSFDSSSQQHISEVTNPTSPLSASLSSPYVPSPPCAVVNFPVQMDQEIGQNFNASTNNNNTINAKNNNNTNAFDSTPQSPAYSNSTPHQKTQHSNSLNNNTNSIIQQQQLINKQQQHQLQLQQQQLQQQQQQILYYQQRQQQQEQQLQQQLQQQRQQQQQQQREQQQQLQLQLQQLQVHHANHHHHPPYGYSHVRTNSATLSSQFSAPTGYPHPHSRSHSRSSSFGGYAEEIAAVAAVAAAHPYHTPTRVHQPPPTLHCMSVPGHSAPRSPIAPFFDDSFLGEMHGGPGALTIASEQDALLAELESREFNYPSLTDSVPLSHHTGSICRDLRRPQYRERQDSGSYSDRHCLLGTLH